MYKLVLFLFLIVPFFSCDEQKPDLIIPYAFVNLDINLNLIQYQNLGNIGGYIYVKPGESTGYKGLIVYHEGNGVYKVFERACSYDPYSTCDPVVVDDSGLFLTHPCCNSTFNFNGNPTGGPASLDLLQYTTYLDGIYLIIRN